MKSMIHELEGRTTRRASDQLRLLLGRIIGVTDGRPMVDYPGNCIGPVDARLAVPAPPGFNAATPENVPVLLLFEDHETVSPIIIGFVVDSLLPSNARAGPERRKDVSLDGHRMVLTAENEIVLRCGKSSIYLGSDGKVVIKGANLISRSSGSNKVKGAAVKIN